MTTDPETRFYLNNEMVSTPPEECDFSVGDKVMFTNPEELVFGPYTVIGFAAERNKVGDKFIHLDWACPWFPIHPRTLEKITQ